MANVVAVRIELHHATESDYQNLHHHTARIGLSRAVIGDDGKTYQLQPGMYLYSGPADCVAVRDAAKSAADATGKSSAVLAIKSDGMAWIGLAEVPISKSLWSTMGT